MFLTPSIGSNQLSNSLSSSSYFPCLLNPVEYEQMKWREETKRRRAAAEQINRERRRREEMHYRQQQRQQQQQQLQQQQQQQMILEEYERQRRKHQQQQEPKLQRMQAQQDEHKQKQQMNNRSPLVESNSVPVYSIVQLPDGRLYKIPVVERKRYDQSRCNGYKNDSSEQIMTDSLSNTTKSIPISHSSFSNGCHIGTPKVSNTDVIKSLNGHDSNKTVDTHETVIKDSHTESLNPVTTTITTTTTTTTTVPEDCQEKLSIKTNNESTEFMKPTTEKETSNNKDSQSSDIHWSDLKENRLSEMILVEDASESENDDDDDCIKSIWRNRRPSPGQWMEPIEIF